MNAYLLSINPEASVADQWDFGLLKDTLENLGIRYTPCLGLKESDVAVVVIPARHNANHITEINNELRRIKHVVLFLLGDEEAEFPVEEIDHPSIHIWVQNPHPGRHDNYHRLGTGYPPQLRKIAPTLPHDKNLNVYFSGQITHKRRTLMLNNLREYELNDNNTLVNRTKGFTQGVDHETYYTNMARSKVAPCPSGAVIPDSFRLFEALECMSIPIADEINPTDTINEYWDWLFDEPTPFPKIQGYDRLVGLIQETLEEWPANMHRITAWWIKYKRDFAYKIQEQLCLI